MFERIWGRAARASAKRGGVVLLFVSFMFGPVYAADDPYAAFRTHDEDSKIHLTYPDWDFVLGHTVLAVGASHRYTPRKPETSTGTRISRSNNSPSWIEGNRVVFDRLNEEGIQLITDFRLALEGIPDQVAMERWSRDEQLAYWLNLYNVTVFEQIAKKYPMRTLKILHEGRGKSKRGSLWEEKLLKVAGVPLSLNDIQNEILIPNYQNPLVLYGMFRAAVGGPNIRRKAFSGKTVWRDLSDNAQEFVNSIRGVHARGSSAEVSLLYEWGQSLFPDFQTDLRRHMEQFADPDTQEILADAKDIEPGYFDWSPADLYDGDPNATRMLPTLYGTGVTSSPRFTELGPTGALSGAGGGLGGRLPPGINSGASNSTNSSGFLGNIDGIGINPEAGLPMHTQALLRALQTKFEIYGYPETEVTIEEIGTAEESDQNQPEN